MLMMDLDVSDTDALSDLGSTHDAGDAHKLRQRAVPFVYTYGNEARVSTAVYDHVSRMYRGASLQRAKSQCKCSSVTSSDRACCPIACTSRDRTRPRTALTKPLLLCSLPGFTLAAASLVRTVSARITTVVGSAPYTWHAV
jgi:hypothetical protein